MQFVLASHNKKKLAELSAIVSSLGIEMRKDSEQKFTPVDNSMFFRK